MSESVSEDEYALILQFQRQYLETVFKKGLVQRPSSSCAPSPLTQIEDTRAITFGSHVFEASARYSSAVK